MKGNSKLKTALNAWLKIKGAVIRLEVPSFSTAVDKISEELLYMKSRG